jgi:hypothetical protein
MQVEARCPQLCGPSLQTPGLRTCWHPSCCASPGGCCLRLLLPATCWAVLLLSRLWRPAECGRSSCMRCGMCASGGLCYSSMAADKPRLCCKNVGSTHTCVFGCAALAYFSARLLWHLVLICAAALCRAVPWRVYLSASGPTTLLSSWRGCRPHWPSCVHPPQPLLRPLQRPLQRSRHWPAKRGQPWWHCQGARGTVRVCERLGV